MANPNDHQNERLNREIYELVEDHKLSYNEVAERYGLSWASVRGRVRRYRKSLLSMQQKAGAARKGNEGDAPLTPDELLAIAEAKLAEQKASLLAWREGAERRDEDNKSLSKSMLLDVLQDAISPLIFTPAVPPVEKAKDDDEEVAVLVLSDLHFGKKTARYNMRTAITRFEKLMDNCVKVLHMQRKCVTINKIVILFTGDIVDGDMVYPTHPHHVDQHVVNQIFLSAPVVAQRIQQLATMFNSVECHCVYGNHGRVSKHHHELSNFDMIYYRTLEVALSQTPNVTFNIPDEGWHQMVNVNGVKILQYHGHQIKMTLNLPWYGITTRVSRWASTDQLADFDIAVQGHFHTSSCLRWNDKQIVTNGTLVDGDCFALEMMGLESSCVQWLFGVHPRRKMTWRHELHPE